MRTRTVAQQFEQAMKCDSREEADAWISQEIDAMAADFGLSKETAGEILRYNLGYWSGFFTFAIRQRIMRLFDAPHPYFGTKDATGESAYQLATHYNKRCRDRRYMAAIEERA